MGRSRVYLGVGILKTLGVVLLVFFSTGGKDGSSSSLTVKLLKACGATQHAHVPGGDTPRHSWKRW